MYLGTGSLHVLFHLSKLQLAALKLLNISLWHIDNYLTVKNLGKSLLKSFSFQVADAHLLSQPTFASSFAILSKPSYCLLTPREKIKLIYLGFSNSRHTLRICTAVKKVIEIAR